jgi:hypothetical protein
MNKKKNKDSIFIQLDTKKLNSAFKMYESGWWTFKKYVYGKKAEQKRIDRHKIISLYILSFLKTSPFNVKGYPKKMGMGMDTDKINSFLANELFSLVLIQVLITA